MNPETISVGRDQLNAAAMLFDVMQAARDLGRPPAGECLSYTTRRPRGYMHPDAAKLFGKEAGREYLGGLAYRDWGQLFNQPASTDVHVDALITEVSVKYVNTELIGSLVFPRVQVTKRSDKYATYGQSPWIRNDAGERAAGTRARSSGYTTSTATYSVVTYAIEHQVPDEVRNNADNPFRPDQDGAEFVSALIDLKLEKQVATLVNTSANWTTNATLSGTSQWSDYTNSDPFTDMKTARSTVLSQTQRRANTVVLGYQTFETLALHPDLLDRVKYTGSQDKPAMVTAQMMAELFQVQNVLVGAAVEDTANENASASLSFVWGKHAWVGFVSPQPALNSPSAGYVFTTGRMADRYREEATRSDWVRAEEAWDTKAVAAGAGYRIINATA